MIGRGTDDLVDFAVSLQARIDDLHRAVDEVAAGLSRIDKRVDGCLSHTSIVRYDAYEDAGGHQSASLAFLDAARSGVVVSAIQGRDYARIYVKELDRGLPGLAELCGGVAFLECFAREDETEGDEDEFQARPAAFYRRRFQALGLRQVGSHCWLAPGLADSAAALELAPAGA